MSSSNTTDRMGNSTHKEPEEAGEGSQAMRTNLHELLSQNRDLHEQLLENTEEGPSSAAEEELGSNNPQSTPDVYAELGGDFFYPDGTPGIGRGYLSTNPDDSGVQQKLIYHDYHEGDREIMIREQGATRNSGQAKTRHRKQSGKSHGESEQASAETRAERSKSSSQTNDKTSDEQDRQTVPGLRRDQILQDGVVAESSAQAAQRASTSLATSTYLDPTSVTHLFTGRTESREGATVKEKPSNIGNTEPHSSPTSGADSPEAQPNTPSNGTTSSGLHSQTNVQPHDIPSVPVRENSRSEASNDIIMRPPWQPDFEVDECPICERPFSFFSRKHHCRKCGRVVCNACSPHRITIPYQYIVQPPTGDYDSTEQSHTRSRTSSNSVPDPDIGGGMRVRLCNPCVPDPNTSPPTPLERPLPPLPPSNSPPPQPRAEPSSRSRRVRRSELCPICGDRLPPSDTAIENHIERCIARHLGNARIGSAEVNTPAPRPELPSILEQPSHSLPNATHTTHHPRRPRHTSEASTLGHFQDTGRNSSAGQGSSEAAPSRPFLSSRMICFAATKLDTTGEDSECIICMEDFEEGAEMARLECLCKYHKNCIDGWFFQHPGRCPVHGQDNY